MIDYLYQTDYDDLLSSPNKVEPLEEAPMTPESPVARTVSYYENLGHNDLPVEEPMVDAVWEPETIGTSEPTAIDDSERALETTTTMKKDKKKKKNKKKRGESQRLCLQDYGGDLDTERLTVNTLMYALADKYEIEDLKALAKAKFEQAVLQDWESRAFAHAAGLAFDTTHSSDQGLRSVIVKTINQHRELVNRESVQDLLKSGNEMAWALIQVLLADRSDLSPVFGRSLFR